MDNASNFDKIYSSSNNYIFGNNPTEIVNYFVNSYFNVGKKVLDIACGEGRDSILFAEYGFEVTALDLSSTGIGKLMESAKKLGLDYLIKPVISDVTTWEFPVNYYDVIFSVTGLDHLTKKQIEQVLQKISLSLKLGGYLILEVHTTDDPGFRGDKENESEFTYMIKTYFEKEELRKLLNYNYQILYYDDRVERDYDHGKPHSHGFASIIAKKK